MATPPRILYVAYPLMRVSADSAGGAEQMLHVVEQEMARRGYETTLAASAGSLAAGELVVTGAIPNAPDSFGDRSREHNNRVLQLICERQHSSSPFDLVHDMSGTFWPCAAGFDLPVLATLHLPRSFYPPAAFQDIPPNVCFNCVSKSQLRSFADVPQMPVVNNGIDLSLFQMTDNKADYLLWLGRICEEKGPDLAIRAAQIAGSPLILAGEVYPFSDHQQYFGREIAPHLAGSSSLVRWLESPSLEEKIRLLTHARALLISSLAEETSSLVAMEAMACGTPVIAFAHGAIPEIVVNGKTGFLVKSVEEMAAAVTKVEEINPAECRQEVEAKFASGRMADDYQRLYQIVLTLQAPLQRAA